MWLVDETFAIFSRQHPQEVIDYRGNTWGFLHGLPRECPPSLRYINIIVDTVNPATALITIKIAITQNKRAVGVGPPP